MDPYAHMLVVSNPIREPLVKKAIEALRLPPGSQGLDVGCGVGLQALRLAEAVGPNGRITGLDGSAAFLDYGREFAGQAGLTGRITFRQGDWKELPFPDQTFDWAWSADAAGYAAHEPLDELRELVRVVRPGGTAAVLYWSGQMLLPGYPALEARLNATPAGIAPFSASARPGDHYLRALGRFHALGLTDLRAETIVHSVFAPMAGELREVREALAALFTMRWGGAQADVSAEDWSAYQRVCRPDSPEFILDAPDYYAFFTCSLFSGRVPAPERREP